MKESIEKKLGCTIEEFAKKMKAYIEKYRGYETEGSIIPDSLTCDELDYMSDYFKHMNKELV